MRRLLAYAILAASVTGCAVNPVTGRPDFMMVSEAQELALGEQNYAPMQQAEGGVYDIDPKLTAYVSEVGNKLAAVSDRPLPYEFVVLNNSVPNAWALPGGKIVINRGLLVELESEAELAAVLGHEIVHADAAHGARAIDGRAAALDHLDAVDHPGRDLFDPVDRGQRREQRLAVDQDLGVGPVEAQQPDL